jgi:hypothetical protein
MLADMRTEATLARQRRERDTDGSASSVVDRVHELVAATVRTHPDIAARAALRSALVDLERLREWIAAEAPRT